MSGHCQSATASHVCHKHSEAAKQQDGSRRQWDFWNQSRRKSGKYNNCHDLQGERAIFDEQPGQLTKDSSQRVHGKASALERRARTTAAHPTARNSAAKAMIARSAPGQATPRPSPVQKMPNAASITPTANLSVFSGTRANGRCATKPTPATSRHAASAPALAGTRSYRLPSSAPAQACPTFSRPDLVIPEERTSIVARDVINMRWGSSLIAGPVRLGDKPTCS
jgi:hypothetical protein